MIETREKKLEMFARKAFLVFYKVTNQSTSYTSAKLFRFSVLHEIIIHPSL
jgi:hypothetical protein